ncbi:efflux RND transporter periplasmic adaptor subunit [Rhodohalobacter sp. SW132]|uniref:efflux RND transporter periplasmic adaptor subunit n=1 Tax=Rhodohalobacter sp. SW132 TaxID=2293433 RepID=UPI000E24FE28|nr:efflux RND transporter periplasmic adaptor subunit [Rhodohalobacter sp. SW132]REL39071.1 efflux RND transporter periplasmic adaptor subunit [Rhodohalobacter sp. SW132]
MKKILATATVITTLIIAGCSGENEADSRDNLSIPSVEAVQAQFGSLPLEERLSGSVRAQQQVEIYPRISAPVEEVYVQNGDQVNRGDPLVRLRDNEYNERLRQAEAELRINRARERQALAELNEAESQLRRQTILAERELSSEIEMERLEAQKQSAEANHELVRAQVEQAESNVEEQKDLLAQTIIRSPIDGTVGQRNADIGMQVSNTTRMFIVGNLNDAKITVNLTERMLTYINQGQTVRVQSEYMGDRMLEGTVSRISPFLGAGSFSTEAEIDISNTRDLLMPGMFVTVDIFYGESEQATIIPLSAIYRHPRTGETGVYIVPQFGAESEPVEQVDSANPPPLSEPMPVEFVPIDVIAQGRESAGVAGIQSGDWVVTVGQNMLINNESESARIRAVSWNRIMHMQQMQPQDLLRDIMNDRAANRSSEDLSTQS